MSDAIVTPTSDGTLATPPVRTPIASADGNALKQWYYYLRQGATLINAHTDAIGTLARALRYGKHADRLTTDPEPPGALWIESDRDNVLYEAQLIGTPPAPAWVFVSGTMADSLSNIPTDLGPNDVNFQFATSDTYELYRWSGSAWVNQTPANNIQTASANANLMLTAAVTAIPGASLTLNRAGLYLITGNFCFVMSGAGDAQVGLRGKLFANSADQGLLVLVTAAAATTYTNASQQWVYRAPSSGIGVYLAAYKDAGGAGSSQVQAVATSITALWVSP